MEQHPSLQLHTKQAQNLKQLQRMIMSPQMQQALSVMQLPILELAQRLELEIAENPLLEREEDSSEKEDDEEELDIELPLEEELTFNDNFDILKRIDEEFKDYIVEGEHSHPTSDDEKLQTFLESSLRAHHSLYDHLMAQAHETFTHPDDLAMAEAIVGNLNSSGFLEESLKEIALLSGFSEEELGRILNAIKEFDPFGVGAANLQESLLLQLKGQNKSDSLAYKIIEQCYEDLLSNRIPQIVKTLKCSKETVSQVIREEIALLECHPGANFSYTPILPIVPDVLITLEGEQLEVSVNEEPLAQPFLNRRYMRMLEDPALSTETKDFIKKKVLSARWFLQTINQRSSTLKKIATVLTKKHKEFFLQPEGQLTPLTMKAVAEELGVHESTVARAVANKFLYCPRGLLPLRYFFSNGYQTKEGTNLSSDTIRQKLKALIDQENKHYPLSDEALSLLLQAQGVVCARRTVTKFRRAVNIGNAQQRKKFN